MKNVSFVLFALGFFFLALPSAQADLWVNIDKANQQMIVEQDHATLYVWKVSTGRVGHETPSGRFHPFWLDADHKSSIYGNAPMPWSIFFNGDIAIHGITGSSMLHLGHRASHGCVRLLPKHAETLFALVKQAGIYHTYILVY